MYLAKRRDGSIGRQIPGPSEVVEVARGEMADRRGNLYLSESQIEDDQGYYEQQELQARVRMAGQRLSRAQENKRRVVAQMGQRQEVDKHQNQIPLDPMNEVLKRYFAAQLQRSETEKVEQSLTHDVIQKPADFAAEGGRPEIVLANADKRPISWRSDFRQELIVGSPLTRDGVFGPAVTDYDRYVNGTDVNQENVVQVAGGTILGRDGGEQLTQTWEEGMSEVVQAQTTDAMVKASALKKGQLWELWQPSIAIANPMPPQPLDKLVSDPPPPLAMGSMGFDFSWEGITNWGSNVVDQTVDNLSDSLPDQLAKEIQQAVAGGASTTTSPTGQITVTRPGVTTYAQSMGVPPWAIYAGLGLMGVGVLLVLVKTLK